MKSPNDSSVNLERLIVDIIRGGMEFSPGGILFSQIQEAVQADLAEGDTPTPSQIYEVLDRLAGYEGMVSRDANGFYTSPDLDALATELGIADLIATTTELE